MKEKQEFLKEVRALDFIKADFGFQGFKHENEYEQKRIFERLR